MTGSLTLVGLGPARSEHTTLEAVEALEVANQSENAEVFAFSSAANIATAHVPSLRIEILDHFAQADWDRATTYRELVKRLLQSAFKEGRDVYYLATGSPLVINDLVVFLRRACLNLSRPVRIIHGMSFFEWVLDRVFWRSDPGIQLLSAWAIASRQVSLDPTYPALLYELGEAPEDAGLMDLLQQELLTQYPPDHQIAVLSSRESNLESRAVAVELAELSKVALTPLSNLWVPGVDSPPMELDVLEG